MIIHNYKAIAQLLCVYNGEMYIALRMYDLLDAKYFLLVNLNNLHTFAAKVTECKTRKSDAEGRYFDFTDIANSK